MSRIILFRTGSAETSMLKKYLKNEPAFEIVVAPDSSQIKDFLERLDGQVNVVIFGCGLENTPAAVLQVSYLFEELRQACPALQIILTSVNTALLEAVSATLAGKVEHIMNLSAEGGLKEAEALQQVRKVVAVARAIRPKGKIPGVLVVDDEPSILIALPLVLLNGGFNKVFKAAAVEEALKVFKENISDIDVCLIDYNLDGGQTAEKLIYTINDLAPRVKIFVLTGEGKNKKFPWSEKMLKVCAGFLGKPFDIGEIVLAIDEVLKNEVVAKVDRRLKILVIDDSPETARIVEGVLGDKFQILVAYDGENGLKIFQELQPELVILDYKLPGKNGMEVLRDLAVMALHLPNGTADLRVVVTTIEKNPQVYTDFTKMGIKNFLYKPINLDEVEKVVKLELGL